jgi:hypothetical protein
MDITQHDIDSLAAKLAGADLSAGEQAALTALVELAEGTDDEEVAGFGFEAGAISFAPLKPAEFTRTPAGDQLIIDGDFGPATRGYTASDDLWK